MEVTLEDAYNEACRALGEATVRERLLTQRLNDVLEQNAALTRQVLDGAGQDAG